MKTEVYFGEENLKAAYEELKSGKTEDKLLYKWISRAISDLEENAFCGIQIPKRLIPEEYITKFGKLHNLWKYNLPNAWRLIYTVKQDKIIVVSIILEWMDHKKYERRLGY